MEIHAVMLCGHDYMYTVFGVLLLCVRHIGKLRLKLKEVAVT